MQLLRGTGQTSRGRILPEPQGLAGWVWGLLRISRGLREVPSKQMHMIETLQLGGKRQVTLISYAGARFLVGGGPESVETIIQVTSEPSPRVITKNMDSACQ